MLSKSFHFTVVGTKSEASQSGFSKTLSFESIFQLQKELKKLKKRNLVRFKEKSCTVYKEVITFDPSAYSRRVMEKTR